MLRDAQRRLAKLQRRQTDNLERRRRDRNVRCLQFPRAGRIFARF
jgi:hypothetical protein